MWLRAIVETSWQGVNVGVGRRAQVDMHLGAWH